jgi:hypothetical protein
MYITKHYLKKIIKEELQILLKEQEDPRDTPFMKRLRLTPKQRKRARQKDMHIPTAIKDPKNRLMRPRPLQKLSVPQPDDEYSKYRTRSQTAVQQYLDQRKEDVSRRYEGYTSPWIETSVGRRRRDSPEAKEDRRLAKRWKPAKTPEERELRRGSNLEYPAIAPEERHGPPIPPMLAEWPPGSGETHETRRKARDARRAHKYADYLDKYDMAMKLQAGMPGRRRLVPTPPRQLIDLKKVKNLTHPRQLSPIYRRQK